jgi:hypothetical protein
MTSMLLMGTMATGEATLADNPATEDSRGSPMSLGWPRPLSHRPPKAEVTTDTQEEMQGNKRPVAPVPPLLMSVHCPGID